MQYPNLVRWFVLALTFVLLSSCASSKQAQKPGGQLDEEGLRAAKKVDDRAERLAGLIPAQTQVLLQVRADELLADLDRLPERSRRTAVIIADQLTSSLDHLDQSRAVLVAYATTGSADYLERAWLNVPATDRKTLPDGVHVRFVLPASDPAKLAEDLAVFCDGYGAGTSICYRETLVRTGEEHVSVDYITSGDEEPRKAFVDELASQEDPPPARLFERRTPALHRFLNTDAPLAAYSTGEGLPNAAMVHSATEAGDALRHATPEHYMTMLLRGESFAFGHLLGDPSAAEYEDVALLVDIVQVEQGEEDGELASPSAQFQVDMIRTYTEHGRNVWVQEPSVSRALRSSVEAPLFEFEWHVPADRLVATAHAPAWTRGEARLVADWSKQLGRAWGLHRFTRFVPLLQYPAGVLRVLFEGADAEQNPQFLAAALGAELVEAAEPKAGLIWRAELFPEQLPDKYWSLVGMLGPFGDHFRAASFAGDTHEITRLQLGGDELATPAALVGFDAAGFEATQPAGAWRACMSAARFEFLQVLEALEMATPENREPMLERGIGIILSDAKTCEEEFPKKAARFRWARGGWHNWQGMRSASAFDFVRARPKLAEACELGYDPACADSERVEALDDFRMPPPAGHFNSQLTMASLHTYPVTSRGIFDGKDLIVEADSLIEAPEKAAEPLAKLIKSRENHPVAQLAADAMTDANLVAAIVEGLQKQEVPTKLLVSVHRDSPRAHVLNLNPPDTRTNPMFRVHIRRIGIEVYSEGEMLEPIDGCAADGPTICLSETTAQTGELLESTRQAWAAAEIGVAMGHFDEFMAAYQLHELYNLLYDLSRDTPDQHTLQFSVADGLPLDALTRVISLARYQREQPRYDSVDALRSAELARDGNRYKEMFVDPVVMPN